MTKSTSSGSEASAQVGRGQGAREDAASRLPQWYCRDCDLGPFGALDYAICPKCHWPMASVQAVEEGR